MANENGVFVFPDVARQAASSIDPNLLLAMQNNGGFGGNNWIWILFLWLIWGNNGNGFGNGNGTGYLANQMSNDAGRDLLLQAINGRADAASQLAQVTNASINSVQTALTTLQSSIQSVGQQVGMSGLQVQNAYEYLNSIVHEAEHVKQAMLDEYDIEDAGEYPAYTMGYLVMRMYDVFKDIIQ